MYDGNTGQLREACALLLSKFPDAGKMQTMHKNPERIAVMSPTQKMQPSAGRQTTIASRQRLGSVSSKMYCVRKCFQIACSDMTAEAESW